MAVAESFRIHPNNVFNPPTVKEQDYIAHSGRFNDTPRPYICTNTGQKCCQENTCKPPKSALQPSLDFMAPYQIIELNNFCRHKRWISPCYKMVSKYNARLPYTQATFSTECIESYPPFSPMMTVNHMDYRDFTDDDVFLKRHKRVVDRAREDEERRRNFVRLQNAGFHTPWSDSRYGTNALFRSYLNRLQGPAVLTKAQPEIPRILGAENYRATPPLDIHRQKIRRFPPNLIGNYPIC